VNLRLKQFAWKRVQIPALCRAGQPGKRDFFPEPVPRRRELVIRPLGQTRLSRSRKVYV